ncbi:MAG: hypothetical protein V1726_06420 [Methanobacteriota archaeon]
MEKGKTIFVIGGIIATIFGVLSGISWIIGSSTNTNWGTLGGTSTLLANGFLNICIAVTIGTILIGVPFLIKKE